MPFEIVPSSMALGTYSIKISGESNSIHRSISLNVKITEPEEVTDRTGN